MQVQAVKDHLKAALLAAGVPANRVTFRQQEPDTQFLGQIWANTTVSGGKLANRNNARVAIHAEGTALPVTRRALWTGVFTFTVDLSGSTQRPVETIVQEVLRYFSTHRLTDAQGNHIPFPRGDEARLDYVDAEGYLLGDHRLRLVLDAELTLYSDTPRVQLDIELDPRVVEDAELTADL